MKNMLVALHMLPRVDGDFYIQVMNREYSIGEKIGRKRNVTFQKCYNFESENETLEPHWSMRVAFTDVLACAPRMKQRAVWAR